MRDELCEEYVNPSTESKFSKQKLVDFAGKYVRRPMGDETDIIDHHRKFNNLVKILVASGHMTRITRGERSCVVLATHFSSLTCSETAHTVNSNGFRTQHSKHFG